MSRPPSPRIKHRACTLGRLGAIDALHQQRSIISQVATGSEWLSSLSVRLSLPTWIYPKLRLVRLGSSQIGSNPVWV